MSLGDLGHLLDDKTVGEIGPVDILLIPVGGTYTIDAEEAVKVTAQLNPRLIIPMHFKTPVMDFPITGVDLFLPRWGRGKGWFKRAFGKPAGPHRRHPGESAGL